MDQETVISEVAHLLDKLERLADSGRRLPWGRQVLVDDEALRTLVQQIRHVLPEQVRQAEWIIHERDRIIAEAGQNADHIVAEAHTRAQALAEDSEVLREAQGRAQEVLREAERRAQEIHAGALAYADEVLERVESQINRIGDTVRQNRQTLKPRSAVNE